MRYIHVLLCALLVVAILPACAEETRIEPAYPVPEYVNWLLDTASAEVGYTEYDHGRTKYGEWAGDPYAQWCAEFLNWCVDQVDQQHGTHLLDTVWPRYSGSNTGRSWYIRKGRYVARNGNLQDWGYQWLKGTDRFMKVGEYIPQPGDWLFFTWTVTNDTDHVAMVEYCAREADGSVMVHVLEGNNPDKVQRNVYPLTYRRILGFGTVHDVMDVTMRWNCTGDKVAALQEKLIYTGYLKDREATGVYGQYTADAVKAFQEEHGLKVNGIANLSTQKLLESAYEQAQRSDPAVWLVVDEEE